MAGVFRHLKSPRLPSSAPGQEFVDMGQTSAAPDQSDQWIARDTPLLHLGLGGIERSERLSRDVIEDGNDAGRIPSSAQNAALELSLLRVFDRESSFLCNGLGHGSAAHGDAARQNRFAVLHGAEGRLLVTDVRNQMIPVELENRGQVGQHQAAGFQDVRIATGRLELIERLGNVVAFDQGRCDRPVIPVAFEKIPVDENVLEFEGRLGFDLEGNRLGESPRIAEGKFEIVSPPAFLKSNIRKCSLEGPREILK